MRTARTELLIIPQRYKFSSKSQLLIAPPLGTRVVDYTAKVQIFEQITTGKLQLSSSQRLLIIPQRYKFSSKSQQTLQYVPYCVVVDYTAKVQIFEQITTPFPFPLFPFLLLIIPQRYKFSSKSQHYEKQALILTVVDYTAKVQIFEQITTLTCIYIF